MTEKNLSRCNWICLLIGSDCSPNRCAGSADTLAISAGSTGGLLSLMEDSDDLALAGSRPKLRLHRDPRLRRKLQKPHNVPSSASPWRCRRDALLQAPAEDQDHPRNESHSRQANVAALNKQTEYCDALPRLAGCPQAVLLMLLSWLPALPSMLSIVAATNRELRAGECCNNAQYKP